MHPTARTGNDAISGCKTDVTCMRRDKDGCSDRLGAAPPAAAVVAKPHIGVSWMQ
jgi:hypothetical protein